MNTVKTCVYAIALNEIKHVDNFMAANQEADLVLVCDTGSTDGTQQRLRELGAVVYDIVQKPWRFDIPRNTALNLIPSDIDICLSIDLDEYLQPGWKTAINDQWQIHDGKIKRISYDYIWNWKPDGITPDLRFFADKIHHRHGFYWKHPCHETLYWDGDPDNYLFLRIPEVILHHRADSSKSRGQYLHLLKIAVDEDPENDRMSHYYGRELMYHEKYEEAIIELKRHLNLKNAQWYEERASSYRYISRCYRNLGKNQESQFYAFSGIRECDTTREPWLELARASHANHDWHTCYWAATKCLSITTNSSTYINDSNSWGSEAYDQAAISAYYLNNKEMAKFYGKKACEISPDDVRLNKNLDFYFDKV